MDHGGGGKKGGHRHHGMHNRHHRHRQWTDKNSRLKEVNNDRKVGIKKDQRSDRENWNRDKEGGHERVWHWDRGFGNKKRWHHHLGDWLEKDNKGEKKRWNEEEHAVRHVEDRGKKLDNQAWKDRLIDSISLLIVRINLFYFSRYHNEKHRGYGHHDDGHRYHEKKKHGVEVHRYEYKT